MPRASFTTLGCKVNQYETQAILDSFEGAGFEIVPFDSPAEVVVINTCSVTSDAEAKSRNIVRRARRLSPDAKVIATGCASQMAINQGTHFAEADLVVPNPDKLESLSRTLDAFPFLLPKERPGSSLEKPGRTRATIKVQDGCSVMCSYCSIPFTRPGMTSRPWQEILAETQQRAADGYLEMVLTGVLIGAYGPETGSGGPDLPGLIRILAAESGIPRIRISSIEVHQVTEDIIKLAEEGAIVPHLHIPLQSGDDQVLADMNRRYRRGDFIRLCQDLERRVPDLMVTTDIMVGFPTEGAEQFDSTLDLCREVRFLKAHVFRFSPRWGTPADKWGDPVSALEKQMRAKQLSDLTQSLGRERMAPYLGSCLPVLVERKAGKDGLMEGLSANWLSVKFAGPASWGRSIRQVRFDELRDGIFYGEAASGTGLPMALSTRRIG